MSRDFPLLLFFLPVLLAACSPQPAEVLPASSGRQVSFEKDAFPIIREYCTYCHRQGSLNHGDIYLETYEQIAASVRQGAFQGSLDGRAPYEPMPPSYSDAATLSAGDAQIIRDWIAQGARND